MRPCVHDGGADDRQRSGMRSGGRSYWWNRACAWKRKPREGQGVEPHLEKARAARSVQPLSSRASLSHKLEAGPCNAATAGERAGSFAPAPGEPQCVLVVAATGCADARATLSHGEAGIPSPHYTASVVVRMTWEQQRLADGGEPSPPVSAALALPKADRAVSPESGRTDTSLDSVKSSRLHERKCSASFLAASPPVCRPAAGTTAPT